jgi:hypothetical protein
MSYNYNPADYRLKFLVTSDPQLFWTEGTGLSTNEQAAQRLIEQYTYIRTHYGVDVMLINGDMTSYGHPEEWNLMKAIMQYDLIDPGMPFAYGLGNHDYINNINDTKNNRGFIRSVLEQTWFVQDLQRGLFSDKFRVHSFDYADPYGYSVVGSLGYTLELGNKFMMMQLHDQPAYWDDNGQDIYVQDNPDMPGFPQHRWTVELKANFEWIEEQLAWAKANDKYIIINKHRHETSQRLQAIFDKYPHNHLKFSGHYHDRLAQEINGFMLSGASCNNTFLYVNIVPDMDDVIPPIAYIDKITLKGGQGEPLTEERVSVKQVKIFTS